jgi:predicted DNA-binding transcriptional regulator YafY
MIGARAFSKEELLLLTAKLRMFTTPEDRQKLTELIRKEIYHYPEIKHDCDSVQDNVWQLVNCINEKREISIDYYRMDRKWVTHRLRQASVMFTDYYFYLIAFLAEGKKEKPYYFRIDRIRGITVHRKKFTSYDIPNFDEGLLRQRSLFMFPGKLQTIRFEFSGPSVQAVLDKLPTAKIIEHLGGRKYLIEAEVYGTGIKMWLLSQGVWIKVLAPTELVDEIKDDIRALNALYSN